MKKAELKKKLNLNKRNVVKLSGLEISKLAGGYLAQTGSVHTQLDCTHPPQCTPTI